MPFLSTQTYWVTAQKHEIIQPFDGERITQGAYELSLGREAYSTSEATKMHLAEQEKGIYAQIPIEPGQFALLLSDETVHIPGDYIGFISIRNRWKTRGLINVSGFHVDPGYRGKLKFAVYNAGGNTITLTRGESIFPLWLAKLDKRTEDPYRDPSEYEIAQRETITSSDIDKIHGNLASPSENHRQIDRLQSRLNIVYGLLATIAAALIASLIVRTGTLNSNVDPTGGTERSGQVDARPAVGDSADGSGTRLRPDGVSGE